MIQQVFTFGYNHYAIDGTPLRDKYVVIQGETPIDCRTEMFRCFCLQWSFQYNSTEDAGVERYGLTPYDIPDTQVCKHDDACCTDECDGWTIHPDIFQGGVPCYCKHHKDGE